MELPSDTNMSFIFINKIYTTKSVYLADRLDFLSQFVKNNRQSVEFLPNTVINIPENC